MSLITSRINPKKAYAVGKLLFVVVAVITIFFSGLFLFYSSTVDAQDDEDTTYYGERPECGGPVYCPMSAHFFDPHDRTFYYNSYDITNCSAYRQCIPK